MVITVDRLHCPVAFGFTRISSKCGGESRNVFIIWPKTGYDTR
jgi:hypothetical protein